MARKASSQRRLQILPPRMKLRSLSGVWHKGKQEILNILWSKVRNIKFCLSSSMQAILLVFCPLPRDFEQVQGEGLPSDGVTHQDGCNSLEQSSGDAEQFDEIEAPLSCSCLKVTVTAKQAFRFTRIVCCKMLQGFFVVFPARKLNRYKEQAWRVTAKTAKMTLSFAVTRQACPCNKLE